MATKAKNVPNEQLPDGRLVWVQGWPRTTNVTRHCGAVEVSFLIVEGDAHEGVCEVQNQYFRVEAQQARCEEGVAVIDMPR